MAVRDLLLRLDEQAIQDALALDPDWTDQQIDAYKADLRRRRSR